MLEVTLSLLYGLSHDSLDVNLLDYVPKNLIPFHVSIKLLDFSFLLHMTYLQRVDCVCGHS